MITRFTKRGIGDTSNRVSSQNMHVSAPRQALRIIPRSDGCTLALALVPHTTGQPWSKKYSSCSHMPPDPSCVQPPAMRRWTTTYCKAECGRRLELPMPTQRRLAGRVRVHETPPPFQVLLLPQRWNVARRNRRSRDIPPRPLRQWAYFLESRSPSNRKSGGQATECPQ